jgi:hypothetical protein
MVEKPNKLQPALIAGLILGVLSSIPVVSAANLCCCLWAIVGGVIAAKILINRSPTLPVSYGDGSATGAIAGAIGSGITLVVGIPLQLVMGDATLRVLQQISESIESPEFREAMRQAIDQAQTQGAGERLAGLLLQWIILSVFIVGFATVGGLIGVALFEKRKG